ncbi:hypothetical protein [Clostridium manihotivorum]|uniref:Uncharacterized protein n=1 Tax=Clostridium manihotivorum TaxID=2320868 RepID=A0A3R5QUM7_9CLOT|nr:hypothetical protein [Clostridium manihotivorum]QAA32755.1 hypothetical protein C1I91_14525 [Clostridium manihotivorum]
MLLCLSSNQNIGIFDFLTKEKGLIIKKLTGEFYLKKFVIHDMRSLSHYSYVAVDLKAIKDNENELIEALVAFKTMYDSRIIIFAEGLLIEDNLIQKLLSERIYNIIIADTVSEIKEQILKCVSEQGMTIEDYRDSEGTKSLSKYIFKHKNIKIAVAGAQNRVGTTTTAFNLTNYLHGIGAKVSYTEANNNEHLKDIAAYYEFTMVSDKCIKYKGIGYYLDKQFPNDYNFNIFDLGILNLSSLSIFKACDVRILCSGSKPYELPCLNKALKLIGEEKTNTIFSFSAEAGRVNLKKLTESENNKVHFSLYNPSLFDGKVNEKVFKDILIDYIIEI